MKLVVFDVDNNLAPLNRAMPETVARRVRALQERATVALASGKPCANLAGFARGAGLEVHKLPLIGENGCDVWLSAALPPSGTLEGAADFISPDVLAELARARDAFADAYRGRIFFQPNRVAVTPFPLDLETLAPGELARFAIGLGLKGTTLFRHSDCIDLVPAGIDKGVAVRALAAWLGVGMSEVASIGDGDNDVPMLEVTDLSIWVGRNEMAMAAAKHQRDTIEAALDLLEGWLSQAGSAAV